MGVGECNIPMNAIQLEYRWSGSDRRVPDIRIFEFFNEATLPLNSHQAFRGASDKILQVKQLWKP